MALNPFGTIGNPLKKKLNPLAQENVPVGQGPIANTSVGSNFLENLQRSNEELKMKIEQDVQPEEAPTFDIKPAYDWKTAPSPFTKENAPTQTGALSGQGVTQGAEPLQMTQGVEPPVIASMEGRKNIPKGSIMDTVVPKANAGENIDTNLSQQAISDIHAGMPIEELSKEYPELAMSKGLFEQYASDVKAGMPQSEGAKMYPELFGKPAVTEAPKEEEGFFDKIGQFAEERGTKALDLQSKDFSDVTKGAGALGEGLGFIGDVVFESLSRMTPDVVKETIKSGAKGAWESIPQSVQNLSVASLKAGGETWKSFEQEYPETARNITSALQIGSAIPIGKGAQVTGKGVVKGLEKTGEVFGKTGEVIGDIGKKTGEVVTAPFKSIINTTKKYAGTPEEVSGIQSAIKPKQRVKNGVLQRSQDQINNEIKLTNGLIRESGEAPVDLATYKDSIKKQMENVGSEINRLTGQDLTVDLTPTAGKIRQIANSREVQLLDPAESGKLLRMADDIEKNGRMKLQDAEAMNQFINDTLKSTTSSASEAYKRGLQILVGDIRQGLDDTISNIPGQFKDIKKTYGALRNVYGDTVAREIVYNRQNMGGLIDSIGAIEGSGNIISGGMKILTGSPGAGLADIGKGITQNAVGRFIKSKNDPNNIIRSIFQKSGEKRSIPDVKNKPKVIPLLPAGKPMTGYAPGKIKATSEALSGKVGERPGTVAKLEDKQGLIKQQQSLLNKDKKLQSDAQEINKLFDNVRGRGTPDVVDRLVLKMEGLFGEDKISIPDAEKILKLSKTKLADDVMDRVYSKLDEKGYTINNDGFIEKVKPTIIPKSKPIQSIPEAKPTQVPTIPKTIETTPTAKKTGVIAPKKYIKPETYEEGLRKIGMSEEEIKKQMLLDKELGGFDFPKKEFIDDYISNKLGKNFRYNQDLAGKYSEEIENIYKEAIKKYKPKPSIISPVKSKSTEIPALQKIIGLTEKGGVKNILPGNQVKYNQGVGYEPVRLVLSDKDAQIARYGAIRNKALARPRTESEKLEMESIIRSTKMTPEEINIRAQEIKDIAKKARSKSESVLVDLRKQEIPEGYFKNAFGEIVKNPNSKKAGTLNIGQIGKDLGLVKKTDDLNPLINEAKKYKSVEEFVKGLQNKSIEERNKIVSYINETNENFYKNFSKDSVVKKLYHGTPKEFDKFQLTKGERPGIMGGNKEVPNKAIFLTENKKMAEHFGDNRADGGKYNLLEVYPKIKKPLDITSGKSENTEINKIIFEELKKWDGVSRNKIPTDLKHWVVDNENIVNKIRELGYDSVKFNESNLKDDITYAVFNPANLLIKNKANTPINTLTDIYNKAHNK